MIRIEPFETRLEPGSDEGELSLELWQGTDLAVRVRYWPTVPEARGREFTVGESYRGNSIGKRTILALFAELIESGSKTFRIVNPNATEPYLAYGCSLDGDDVIVDLINGPTLDRLRASL